MKGEPGKRGRLWRWWWRAFPVVVVLAAVGYVGYRWWPVSVRLVGEWPEECTQAGPYVTMAGFLVVDKSTATLRRWDTGAAVWKVSFPADTTAYVQPSPSGLWLTAYQHTGEVDTWHQGIPIGHVVVPGLASSKDYNIAFRSLDDGRTIVIINEYTGCHVYALSDGRILAQGRYRADILDYEINIAPDGMGFIVETSPCDTFVQLSVVGGKCRFSERDHTTLSKDAGGTALCPGAAWVDQNGAIGLPSGVRAAPPISNRNQDSGQSNPYMSFGVTESDGIHLVALAPATGDRWGVVLPRKYVSWGRYGFFYGVDAVVTPDGNFLLVQYPEPGTAADPFIDVVAHHVPWIGGYLVPPEQLNMTMYRRPGTATARIHLNIPAHCEPAYFWPAPDGRGMAGLWANGAVGGLFWRLYRW